MLPQQSDRTAFCSPCDGDGVRVDHGTGKTIQCPDCGGRRMTNAEVREARATTGKDPS
jgi:DNA-directed RNA polymerase subunit RPC12/RpoP